MALQPPAAVVHTTAQSRLRLTPLIAVLLVAVMSLPLQTWADFDIFWHLSNGRLMARDGDLPSPDQFSWSAAGEHVALNSVQMDRAFYLMWDGVGPAALGVFSALLFGAALLPYALMIGRAGLQPWAEALAVMLLAFTLLPYAGARPHLVGTVLLGVIALAIERPLTLARALIAGAALALWVNLHGSFIVGFVLVGALGLVALLARDRRAVGLATLAAAIGAGGTALSPYGAELWTMPFKVSSHPMLASINRDWFSLKPFSPEYASMGLLIVAAAALGVWRRSDPMAIAALIMLAPTIQYARFTPFTAPLLLIAVLGCLIERAPWLTMREASAMRANTERPAIQRLAWGILAAGSLLTLVQAPSSLEEAAYKPLPEAAVSQLISCGAPAAVWNDYNWGGYLLWRGDGRFTVGIDGRAEALYSVDDFDRYLTVINGQIGWDAIVLESPTRYALFPANSGLPISSLAGWRVVYSDDIAIVAARDGAVWRCA